MKTDFFIDSFKDFKTVPEEKVEQKQNKRLTSYIGGFSFVRSSSMSAMFFNSNCLLENLESIDS